MTRSWIALVVVWGVACGDDSSSPDAGTDGSIVDAGVDAIVRDTGDDAIDSGADGGVDAALDAMAEMGFGEIGGPCPLIMDELTGDEGAYFSIRLDFADDPFDDPEDTDQLTLGGQEILAEGTLGGSSGISEVFAYEVLQRCEGAFLIKSETEIMYMPDTPGPSTDILVGFDATKIGVSVTRAVGFPRDDPYTVERATTLLEDKLGDVLLSSARVRADDAWVKQILVVMAYAEMHADSLQAAWLSIDPDVRADTLVYVVVTDGMDGPVYGD